ncbi:MAG: alkaline phosphatase family protein [Pirellulales bacterium]|nr:alkaline phosphatase family protein [Pirellulales bacterium]
MTNHKPLLQENGPSHRPTPAPNRNRRGLTRRQLLTGTATAGLLTALAGTAYYGGGINRISKSAGQKVIVIGIDGMDPRLSRQMMSAGELPNLQKMSRAGGFSPLATSIPPQSPVAWASFINGAGPGSHGLFDFVHRHPEEQCKTFYSGAETMPGQGGWTIGDHQLQLDFWPFQHQPPSTVLRRQGTPFWDFLDAAGIPSTFYDLPSNYPPSPSVYGHHRCLSGMGTPDMQGSYGTYQYFSQDTPAEGVSEGGGNRARVEFDNETALVQLIGPTNSMLLKPQPVTAPIKIHRDRAANAVVLEIGEKRILLKPGEWSAWVRVPFLLSAPAPLPAQSVSGIVRFYLQEAAPNFRLYATPINIDPTAPAVTLSEPASFVGDLANDLGLFYTTGFQEDHKARTNGIFDDDEYQRQANLVLEERLALLERAVADYDDGLLFFYFSSSDLQSHMFWWDSDDPHPIRDAAAARQKFQYIRRLYQRLDQVIGELYDNYGDRATLIVMSDHGFANFGRQFNLNSWLRDYGYLGPTTCTSIMHDVDWSQTVAYGLGINGLYLNLKGRERDGIVEPGEQRALLLEELCEKLLAVRDFDDQPVIRQVYRAEKIYHGSATALAPDLIVGYARGYRASWETCLGDLTEDVLLDNTAAWSADHCCDADEVPGLLCCNRPLTINNPSLIDIAPSILAKFGLDKPSSMQGRTAF